MIIKAVCSCGHYGNVYIPPIKPLDASKLVVECPSCKAPKDMSPVYDQTSLEEVERAELERLQSKYKILDGKGSANESNA